MAEKKDEEICLEQSPSSPHESLFYILAYLSLFELLSMTRVCISLRDAINNDILPWMNIIVEPPLSSRLTDDTLMEVVSKAKGKLRVLSLINSVRITDDGLFNVVAQNPRISKLHVPGCTSLSPEGVIRAVKFLSQNNHKLNTLKISGIYGIRNEHLQTLRSLLIHSQTPHNQRIKKIFYHEYKSPSTHKHYDTSHPIDVDICPKCEEVRMVFDCPRVLCDCRGCDLCVMRCIECGICLKGSDEEVEEGCCGDMLCLECWLKLPKCSFCNKPYCNLHLVQQHRISGSMGFVCDACEISVDNDM